MNLQFAEKIRRFPCYVTYEKFQTTTARFIYIWLRMANLVEVYQWWLFLAYLFLWILPWDSSPWKTHRIWGMFFKTLFSNHRTSTSKFTSSIPGDSANVTFLGWWVYVTLPGLLVTSNDQGWFVGSRIEYTTGKGDSYWKTIIFGCYVSFREGNYSICFIFALFLNIPIIPVRCQSFGFSNSPLLIHTS